MKNMCSLLLLLLAVNTFASAATCDSTRGSSSVDQLVTLANNNLSVTREITGDTDDFLPVQFIKYLCTTINLANSSSKDPHEEFMKMLQRLLDKKKIDIDDLNKYTYQNIDKFICENSDTIKMRKTNTLLKYALDSRNYDFIRGALFIRENGKNICNPYIDFNRKEIIDGQEETLINFIDKLLVTKGMSATHDFTTIKSIKLRIEGCLDNK